MRSRSSASAAFRDARRRAVKRAVRFLNNRNRLFNYDDVSAPVAMARIIEANWPGDKEAQSIVAELLASTEQA